MSVAMIYFDPIDYAQRLRNSGASQELADVIAQETEKTIQVTISQVKSEEHKKGLVTKGDLQLEIEKVRNEIAKLRYDTLKFIVWTGIGVVITLGGMIARGFHWL